MGQLCSPDPDSTGRRGGDAHEARGQEPRVRASLTSAGVGNARCGALGWFPRAEKEWCPCKVHCMLTESLQESGHHFLLDNVVTHFSLSRERAEICCQED